MYFTSRKGRCIELFIGKDSIIFQATKSGTSNKTGAAMISTVSQLNHFVTYLQRRADGSELDLANRFKRISQVIDRDIAYEEAVKAVARNKTDIRDEMKRYFTEAVKEEFFDDYFFDLLSEYIHDNNDHNLEINEEIEVKLYDSDLHVYLCLSLFSKILYLLYFRICEFRYNDVTRDLLIHMSEHIDKRCWDLYENDRHILDLNFTDRMYEFAKYKISQLMIDHTYALNTFGHRGLVENGVVKDVFNELITGCKSFTVMPYVKVITKNGERPHYVMGVTPFETFGYVSKQTVGFLDITIKRATDNKFKDNPKYVSKVASELTDSSSSQLSDSSKYKIFMEKKNREVAEYLDKLKKLVLSDCDKILSDKDIREIREIVNNSINIRHKLNEFIVSQYLEQEYDNNLIEMLSYEDFVKVVFTVSHRLSPTLALGCKSEIGVKKNGVKINDESLQKLVFFREIQDARSKTIINSDILSNTYVYRKNGTLYHFDIKDDFIKFVERGCIV